MATMIDDGPKVIQELFPVSLQDPRTGRQYWHAPAVVANDVIQTLFEKCSQAPPVETGPGGRGQGRDVAQTRARVSEVQMSLGKLMGHPAVTGGREGRVDVDDVLWLIMKHWLVGERRTTLAACQQWVLFLNRNQNRSHNERFWKSIQQASAPPLPLPQSGKMERWKLRTFR